MKDLTYLEPYREKGNEKRLYGENGDAHNGIFKVFVNGKSFWCIASNGGGDEPSNLVTLCKNCHRERHRLLKERSENGKS